MKLIISSYFATDLNPQICSTNMENVNTQKQIYATNTMTGAQLKEIERLKTWTLDVDRKRLR